MDQETLAQHRALCVKEPTQHAAHSLPKLTEPEQSLYDMLKKHELGDSLRLEQERIDWAYAWQIVKSKPFRINRYC